jgi:hypothetical protein
MHASRVVRRAWNFFAIDGGYISFDTTKRTKIIAALYLAEYGEAQE